MAKRFTDSNKFRDNWYRKLKPKHKCLWEYMLAECSVAGTLEIDLDSISFHIGDKITNGDLTIFKDRIFFIEETIIFIPKFLQFQQPNGLNRANKAHNNIFKTLEKYKIPETLEIQGEIGLFQEPSKELPSSPSKGKGNSKGNSISFSVFYDLYPIKKSKIEAEKKWNKLEHSAQKKCISALSSDNYKEWLSTQDKKYIKHPSTWLHQGCWDDVLTIEPKEDEPSAGILEKNKKLLASLETGDLEFKVIESMLDNMSIARHLPSSATSFADSMIDQMGKSEYTKNQLNAIRSMCLSFKQGKL